MIDYGQKGYKLAAFAVVLALLALSAASSISSTNNTCNNCTIDQSLLNLKVNKSGDTMTGNLNVDGYGLVTSKSHVHLESSPIPLVRLGVTDSDNAYLEVFKNSFNFTLIGTPSLYYTLNGSGLDMQNRDILNCANCINTTQLNSKVNKTGDNMTGELNMTNNNVTDINILDVHNGITMRANEGLYVSYQNITNGTRPYVLNLTISNAVGVNNATNVYCNGHCDATVSNVKFFINGSQVPHCTPIKSTGKTWVNLTSNGTLAFVYGYNTSLPDNCKDTTYQYQGDTSVNYLNTSTLPVTNFTYESVYRPTANPHDIVFGTSTNDDFTGDTINYDDFTGGGFLRLYSTKNGVSGFTNDGVSLGINTDYRMKFTYSGTEINYSMDEHARGSRTTNLPDSKMGIWFHQYTGSAEMKYGLAIPYTPINEPTFITWGSQETYTNASAELFCVRISPAGNLFTISGACT